MYYKGRKFLQNGTDVYLKLVTPWKPEESWSGQPKSVLFEKVEKYSMFQLRSSFWTSPFFFSNSFNWLDLS